MTNNLAMCSYYQQNSQNVASRAFFAFEVPHGRGGFAPLCSTMPSRPSLQTSMFLLYRRLLHGRLHRQQQQFAAQQPGAVHRERRTMAHRASFWHRTASLRGCARHPRQPSRQRRYGQRGVCQFDHPCRRWRRQRRRASVCCSSALQHHHRRQCAGVSARTQRRALSILRHCPLESPSRLRLRPASNASSARRCRRPAAHGDAFVCLSLSLPPSLPPSPHPPSPSLPLFSPSLLSAQHERAPSAPSQRARRANRTMGSGRPSTSTLR
jgi:hypothetical protein